MSFSKKEFYKALDKVTDRLCSMSDEEFKKTLEAHKDGDIAQIILETGALRVGEIEAEAFDDYSAHYYNEGACDLSFLQSSSEGTDVVFGTLKNVSGAATLINNNLMAYSLAGHTKGKVWSNAQIIQPLILNSQGSPPLAKLETFDVIHQGIIVLEESSVALWKNEPLSNNVDKEELGLAA